MFTVNIKLIRQQIIRRSRRIHDNFRHNAHLRQECHNSKFGIFELAVQKETFADAFLTGTVS